MSVALTRFGTDGWQVDRAAWNEKFDDEPLSTFLARFGSIPSDESEELARDLVLEWRARGGEAAARRTEREVFPPLIAVFGLAAVGALGLLAALAYLLFRVFA